MIRGGAVVVEKKVAIFAVDKGGREQPALVVSPVSGIWYEKMGNKSWNVLTINSDGYDDDGDDDDDRCEGSTLGSVCFVLINTANDLVKVSEGELDVAAAASKVGSNFGA